MDDLNSTAKDWLSRARTEESKGEFLSAYDLALIGIEENGDNVELKYHAVRALVRSGAVAGAEALYQEYELGSQADEDIASLGAANRVDVVEVTASTTQSYVLPGPTTHVSSGSTE